MCLSCSCVADLFLYCYERDFILSLSDDNMSEVIDTFNSTPRYLDDLLNIDNNMITIKIGQSYLPLRTSVK